jgi:RNA polymerase sigma-70 factor (ECF subfamily)
VEAVAAEVDWTLNVCAASNRTMEESDDAVQWVRRMAEGDPSGAAGLYAACGRRLYAYALRLTGNPALAEDVTQETLVTAWRTADRYRGDGRVRTWLLGIVHHTALNAMRRRWQPVSKELAATLATPAPSPEEQAQADELAACVRRALQSISLKHRAALELVFFHGLSLEEAAEVCGCPVGTIKSRLSYAKASLKDALAGAGIAAGDAG